MLRNPASFAVALVALLAARGPGQQMVVTISPNPAPLGSPVTVTGQATAAGLYTPFGCLVGSVRSGMPGGPIAMAFGCTLLGVAIPQCGAPTFRQSQFNAPTAAGQYWIEIQHQPGLFTPPLTSEWFCLTVYDPVVDAPVTLAAANAPLFGTTFQMSLTSPGTPAAPYGVALSFTTNVGIPYTGGHAALDADALFYLSLTQDPSLFGNFTGTLDAAGVSPPILLAIPAVPGIACLPIHAQAVVFGGSAPFVLSNQLPVTIQ
jgi:hypothetical protein